MPSKRKREDFEEKISVFFGGVPQCYFRLRVKGGRVPELLGIFWGGVLGVEAAVQKTKVVLFSDENVGVGGGAFNGVQIFARTV